MASITSVASFYLGIVMALIGVALLLPIVLRLRKSQTRKAPVYAGGYPPGYDPREDERELDPDADPCESDYEEEGYDRGRRSRGYDGYPGSYGMGVGRNGRHDRSLGLAGR